MQTNTEVWKPVMDIFLSLLIQIKHIFKYIKQIYDLFTYFIQLISAKNGVKLLFHINDW